MYKLFEKCKNKTPQMTWKTYNIKIYQLFENTKQLNLEILWKKSENWNLLFVWKTLK